MRKGLMPAAAWVFAVACLTATPAHAQDLPVRAVLFYSPTCPHCHIVIENTLMPLSDQYGEQLQLLAVDTTTAQGWVLYRSAMERFEIPEERWGVPILIVGETVLHGSLEIPERFPPLVEAGLAQGGIDWPDIPGLRRLLSTEQTESPESSPDSITEPAQAASGVDEIVPASEMPPPEQDSLWATIRARLSRDPLGNALSIVVLVGMVASVATLAISSARRGTARSAAAKGWAVPLLAAAGMLVAGYLAFVETTGTEAVCGPVGDCNSVQQSPYAMLFGSLPVGVLGLVGYLAILATWLVMRLTLGKPSELARLALFGLTAFGVLFSIYLTFLEPFVIGATCAWCLSSAVIMTTLMWLSAPRAA